MCYKNDTACRSLQPPPHHLPLSLPCFTPLASKSDNHYGQRDLGAKFRRSAEREGNQRITAERERRRKERRMREAEGEAGSASAGRKAALMYPIQTMSEIRWSWNAVSS